MKNVKIGSIALTGAIALYSCHIAGVASMPGQNQTFFLDVIYLSQVYLFLAVLIGYYAGVIKAVRKAVLALVGVSTLASLIGIGFAGTASMEGPNQLGFLGQFFGMDAVLVIASLGAYVLGTRHKKPAELTGK